MRHILSLIFMLSCALSWAQDADFVRAYLVVASPGESVQSVLGHAAIRMECPTHHLDYCFSYEMAQRPGEQLKFLTGRAMSGWVMVPTDAYVNNYQSEHRGVVQYKLNLTPAEEQRLWRELDHQMAKGLQRPYDFLNFGCAVCVARVVRSIIDERIDYPTDPDAGLTRREVAHKAFVDAPWADFFWLTITGTEADEPCSTEERLVLPSQLTAFWKETVVTDSVGDVRPLLESDAEVLAEAGALTERHVPSPTLLTALLLVAALIATAGQFRWSWSVFPRIVDILLFGIQFFLGTLLTYLWLFSTLVATSWNWFLIPFNVVPLLVWLYASVRRRPIAPGLRLAGALVLLLFIVCSQLLPQPVYAPQLLLCASLAIRSALGHGKWKGTRQAAAEHSGRIGEQGSRGKPE